MVRAVYIAVVAVIITLGASGVADAKAGVRTTSPCVPDYKRLCSKTPVGEAASCLKKHMSELSPACKARFSK
ncbi:hypothetical protein LGH82_28125 [Mesorhizobium sp. PAMC28654]|uniref:hypothetical protein n=1 Tax=Mesorhizobium sp. PAMC28654 TaxID=2880934 RepID=UPI001D0A74A2|nr:hypothetical protein [Mesorhizobium sp. PAMC28654]UDL88930.1 hypothetical protein LGH82_28125 [Mesorhizobium sp. PAMC28654]